MKTAAFYLVLLSLGQLATTQSQILSIDGSGTTNPSKCYWSIMETMAARDAGVLAEAVEREAHIAVGGVLSALPRPRSSTACAGA